MNGRPGKTAFADNFSACNRLFSDKANFTPYSLDALRRDDFSKTVHQRRSPSERNQLTGLASVALSAFLPQQQQTLGEKSSFLSSIRFGGSLDQQSTQHSFRQQQQHHHHHFLGNGSRFPFILRHRQGPPADILSGSGKSGNDDFHQRRRDQHRRHFKSRQSHFLVNNNDRFQRSLSPCQNVSSTRKRSYRDLDAPDPVQAKLDRRRLVSYADIVCPNDDEPVLRPRWNRRRRYSSSNERTPNKQQASVAAPAVADTVQQPQPEVVVEQQPIKEQKDADTKEQGELPVVESPEEEDEFEQNLKAELERVKGNDGRKQQERQEKPLNADQILKHLTRNTEPPTPSTVCNGANESVTEERGMSVDLASVDGHSNVADEPSQATADPSLLSKRLATDHHLVVRQTPFSQYECNRDFKRRLRREYQQVLGCGRMPKPLSNFQTFSVLMELAELHLNNGKPPTNVDDEQMSLVAENKNDTNAEVPAKVNVSASTTATTADLLGYMKCILQQTSNPLSFGMSGTVPGKTTPLQHMLASTGLQLPLSGMTPQQPISMPAVTLPFDFRPCVPPPNYRPQQPMPAQQAFQQFASSPGAFATSRLPLLTAFQQNRQQSFATPSSVDLPRLLRSDQFTNALLQLTAAAADNRQFSGNAPAQIASMANSFLAASQNSLYNRSSRRHGGSSTVLNPMSEVVREAQEFVRSRLASNAAQAPPIVDLKPIPNVIGPLGNTFSSNPAVTQQQWSSVLPGSPSLTQDEFASLVKLSQDSGGESTRKN